MEALSHETYEPILHDAKLATQWISDILINYLKQNTNE
jgi:hypothetical protein